MSPDDFKLVRSLFHQAFDLSPGDAAALLERECAGRDDVRSEVESLLRANRKADTRFNPLDGSIAQQLLTQAAGWDGNDPEQIGPYRIVRRIGQGGMGVVYLARQSHPERAVALKVLRGAVAPTGLRKRFEREVRLLGQLHHPGIAQIYEAGVAEAPGGGGTLPYFAMEYVDGSPLTEYANARRLCTDDRLELFAKVCDAVQHAHQKGVIHRDLKPANILVVDDTATNAPTDGTVGRPRILDFGVARLTDTEIQTVTMQTDVGQLIGTIPYMSPEQVLGDSSVLDTRSDIYSLGVVLFELLSGRRPYDLRGRSLAEAAKVITEQEPTSLGSVDTTLRGDLDTIVLKALEKEKDRRYVSAADLAADIRRYLSDQPITARPQTTFYLFRKFARRNRGLVIASAAAVVCLVVGLIVVSILAQREARLRRSAERIAYRASIGSATAMLQNHDVVSARVCMEKTAEELRGWEWQYLWNQLDNSLTSIEVDKVYPAYAFMNKAGKIVSCLQSSPPVLRRWEPRGNPAPSESDDHGVVHYAQSPRGTATLWITTDGMLQIRLLNEGAVLKRDVRTCRPTAGVRDYWYMPSDDGRYVMFRELGIDQICVLDVASGETFTRGVFLEAWYRRPVFVGGDWVASPILDCKCIELWNFRTGRTRTLALHPAAIESIAVSPDGESIFTGAQDSILRRWSVSSGELEAMGQGHSGYILHVACSPDRRIVATNATDNTVRLWDAATLQSRRVYHGHTSMLSSLVYSPDGTKVITMAGDGTIRTWDAIDSGEPDVRSKHRGYVYSLAFAPDGRRVISAGWDGFFKSRGGIKIWDAGVIKPISEIADAGEWFFHAAFSPDGKKFAVTGNKGLDVYDSATGRLLIRRSDIGAEEHMVAFDPSGDRVLLGNKLIDCTTGKDLACRIDGGGQVAWSRNGQWIATGPHASASGVRLWDAQSQREIRRLDGPRGAIGYIAFSHDGRFLAAASDARTTFVWSISDGRLAASLDSAGGDPLCVAFSPDGARLATGGRDQVIHLWDTKSFEEVAQLHGHNAYVKTLAFSPDGTMLLSGSGDGTIRIWDSKPIGIIKGE